MAFFLSGEQMGPREKGPGLELSSGETWAGLEVLPHTCRPLALVVVLLLDPSPVLEGLPVSALGRLPESLLVGMKLTEVSLHSPDSCLS